MRTFLQSAAKIGVESCAIALVLTATLLLLYDNLSDAGRWKLFIEALLYSTAITTLALTLLPRVWPLVTSRSRAVQWTVFILGLSIVCALGSLIGSAVVVGTHLEPGMTLLAVFTVSFRKSIVFALIGGVIHVSYDLLRNELRDTQLALRTKEREHERALKLAAEARLAELEARVHPHFLFNTLNSISALIPVSPQRAERLLERMAALLRFTLERPDRGLVNVEEELKIVGDYLEIEQTRLGPRLRYKITTSGDLSGSRVPPLSIQSLAENSIKHAVAPERRGGEVHVRAICDAAGLTIEVSDTGPGFSLERTPPERGLSNLRNRLAAHFGDSAEFRVEQLDGWTIVGFHLPPSQI